MSTIPQPANERFAWPEILVTDLIAERYYDILDDADAGRIARLHAHVLQQVFYGDVVKADASRKTLLADCAVIGVGAREIAAVDRCAFWEIAALINTRLRPTARATAPITENLHAAVCRLGSMGVAG